MDDRETPESKLHAAAMYAPCSDVQGVGVIGKPSLKEDRLVINGIVARPEPGKVDFSLVTELDGGALGRGTHERERNGMRVAFTSEPVKRGGRLSSTSAKDERRNGGRRTPANDGAQ